MKIRRPAQAAYTYIETRNSKKKTPQTTVNAFMELLKSQKQREEYYYKLQLG